ncbi:MAG: alpha-L-glutamate ligase [Gemmatimonadales bacterium]|nr:alpha-L-glutamate ligase [Gemmatimonadales bacterium]MYG47826.1 alpha-L-glutamate ligase [Gemmatimonadales bacterium]MYK02551.1 alpha-L-glutamate ligase [Candidatus Palauibacter ramosifaciens]
MIRPDSPQIHVLYENPAWIPPLEEALAREGFRVRLVHVNEGLVDPSAPPPEGIWINRISPSSHTRGHVHTVELARQLLYWLEAHDRRVINGLGAFELEMSKLRQDLVLRRHGIRTPRTVLAVGREHLLAAAATFDGPFITKHDQGGKGLGIRLFRNARELERHLDADGFDAGPGARMILQQYIDAPEPFITRVEIVGGRFLFAMRSSTADGFELCPSDACNPMPSERNAPSRTEEEAAPEVCPAGPGLFSSSPVAEDDPLVQRYIRLCNEEGIEIAGIEFVRDAWGHRYTYDINGTTNYNQTLGTRIGVDGMGEVARYVRRTATPGRRRRRRIAS